MKHNEELCQLHLRKYFKVQALIFLTLDNIVILYSHSQSVPNFLLQRLHQLQFAATSTPSGRSVKEIKMNTRLNKFTKRFMQRTDHYT